MSASPLLGQWCLLKCRRTEKPVLLVQARDAGRLILYLRLPDAPAEDVAEVMRVLKDGAHRHGFALVDAGPVMQQMKLLLHEHGSVPATVIIDGTDDITGRAYPLDVISRKPTPTERQNLGAAIKQNLRNLDDPTEASKQ